MDLGSVLVTKSLQREESRWAPCDSQVLSVRSSHSVTGPVLTYSSPLQAAAVALSSLVHALDELNMVAIVRYAYDKRSNPQVGVAFPYIKDAYEVKPTGFSPSRPLSILSFKEKKISFVVLEIQFIHAGASCLLGCA